MTSPQLALKANQGQRAGFHVACQLGADVVDNLVHFSQQPFVLHRSQVNRTGLKMRWVRLDNILLEPLCFRRQRGGFDETNGVIVRIVGFGALRFAGFIGGQKRAQE